MRIKLRFYSKLRIKMGFSRGKPLERSAEAAPLLLSLVSMTES
jgi:hypothetical protein